MNFNKIHEIAFMEINSYSLYVYRLFIALYGNAILIIAYIITRIVNFSICMSIYLTTIHIILKYHNNLK